MSVELDGYWSPVYQALRKDIATPVRVRALDRTANECLVDWPLAQFRYPRLDRRKTPPDNSSMIDCMHISLLQHITSSAPYQLQISAR